MEVPREFYSAIWKLIVLKAFRALWLRHAKCFCTHHWGLNHPGPTEGFPWKLLPFRNPIEKRVWEFSEYLPQDKNPWVPWRILDLIPKSVSLGGNLRRTPGILMNRWVRETNLGKQAQQLVIRLRTPGWLTGKIKEQRPSKQRLKERLKSWQIQTKVPLVCLLGSQSLSSVPT